MKMRIMWNIIKDIINTDSRRMRSVWNLILKTVIDVNM
jgi:hypothetical protein